MSNDTDIFVEDFLEHFGVKGMRWGVRRAPSNDSGSNSGGEKTRKQKVVKGLKIAGGAAAVAGVSLLGYKAVSNLNKSRKMDQAIRSLSSMSAGERKAVGARFAKNMNLKVPQPKSFPSYKNDLHALQNAHLKNMKDLNLPEPSMQDLAAAAKKLGFSR